MAPDRAPRLLFVVNNPGFFVTHRLEVGRAAMERGWEVHLAAPAPEEAPSTGAAPGSETTRRVLSEAGIVFHPVPLYRRWLHLGRDAATVVRLARLYRELRPDLVHHVTYKAIVLGGAAARLTGIPAVVNAVPGLGHLFSVHGRKGRALREIMYTGYRMAFGHPRQVAVFQNPEHRELFVQIALVERSHAELIRGSGVDPDRFRPTPEPEGPPLVVFASRMIWTKGVGEFVRAAELLGEGDVEARFALVGGSDPGNPAAVPEAELRRWDDEGAVEWWGYRDDMPEVLAASAVVCLPSHYGEGLPKILLEGAAAGRPLVATDMPGCREVVLDGETGLLVPPEDPEALAEALERLLTDPGLRRRMGERGREHLLRHFTRERVVEGHLALYRRLLEGRP